MYAFFVITEQILAQSRRSTKSNGSGRSIFSIQSRSSATPQPAADFDCPEEFGYYPHPTDCSQYYVCVFGSALLESCTGGLMYSNELQTCDWPRNVGCDLPEIPEPQRIRDIASRVPHKVRFSGVTNAPQQQQRVSYQPSPQPRIVISSTIPPPPELRVAPNPVITTRGQPRQLLDPEDDIAKLYADAHDTIVEEDEETDRQQRVYRGQPSTVSQVQRDRDGIIQQANINAIPNQDKIGSYSFVSTTPKLTPQPFR